MRITPNSKSAVLWVLLGALFFGTTGFFVKIAALPAISASFFRVAIPFIFAVAWKRQLLTQMGRAPKKYWWISLLNSFRLAILLQGFLWAPLMLATAVLHVWPFFLVLFGRLFFKQHIYGRQVLYIAMGFAGIVLIYVQQAKIQNTEELLGLSCVILSAMAHALSTAFFKNETKHLGPVESLFYQNALSVVLFLPFVLWYRPWPELEQIGYMITYGVTTGLIGYGLFFFGLQHLTASTVSGLTYFEVVSASLLGYFVFNERLNAYTLTGMALILVSSYLVHRFEQGLGKQKDEGTDS